MILYTFLSSNCWSIIYDKIDEIKHNPTCFITALLLSISTVCYIYILLHNSRNNRWKLPFIIGACTITIIGSIVHIFILKEVGVPNEPISWFAIALMAFVSSIELFVGSTKMFDNGIQEVLFGTQIDSDTTIPGNTVLLIFLTAVYMAAIITTAYLIFMFFLRHFYSRRWLRKNKEKISNETYVLFGINSYVRSLITDLSDPKCHPNSLVLVVDYLKENEKDIDVSVLERMKSFLFQKEETIDGATIVLKAKKNLANADPNNLCESLGLKHLRPYLDGSKNIYLLHENQDENIAALNNLLEAKVTCEKIYCHARNDELNNEIEEAYYNRNTEETAKEDWVPRVVFVDSSMLSVRSLLRTAGDEKKALPVNYVKIASESGQNLGYVETGFKALILGFGETGQEALSFLYEYGAFVGKNKKKAPFECHAYDSRMDEILDTYAVSHPGLNQEAGVFYHAIEIGNGEFLDSFEKEIPNTNYIVVCGGTDEINLKIVQFITQHLGHRDTSVNFCIWVRMYNPNCIVVNTLNSMSKRENDCIHKFGMIDEIWSENVITDESLKEEAMEFHASYLKAKYGEDIPTYEQWRYVEDIIHKVDSTRKDRLNAIRMMAQNYANYLHLTTKYKLMDGPLLHKEAMSVAERIPGDYVGTLFNGDAKTKKIIEYLAIGEHLRWEASHVVHGYQRGMKTDPEMKVHKYIKDYSKLSPEIQLFDWVVVKTTLEWYAKKIIKDE